MQKSQPLETGAGKELYSQIRSNFLMATVSFNLACDCHRSHGWTILTYHKIVYISDNTFICFQFWIGSLQKLLRNFCVVIGKSKNYRWIFFEIVAWVDRFHITTLHRFSWFRDNWEDRGTRVCEWFSEKVVYNEQ